MKYTSVFQSLTIFCHSASSSMCKCDQDDTSKHEIGTLPFHSSYKRTSALSRAVALNKTQLALAHPHSPCLESLWAPEHCNVTLFTSVPCSIVWLLPVSGMSDFPCTSAYQLLLDTSTLCTCLPPGTSLGERENGETLKNTCEARALHTQGSWLRHFAPSENVQKRLFCSLWVMWHSLLWLLLPVS